MPNNFPHIGLIKMILPNAKIIDARRNPMDGCFSCFKQYFAKGQHFTYDLDDIARYYKDYLKIFFLYLVVLFRIEFLQELIFLPRFLQATHKFFHFSTPS